MNSTTSSKTRERFTFASPPPPDPLPNRCAYAEALYAVCEPMVEKVRQSPSEISVNVALLQLQMQYWMRFETAPRAHREHIGGRARHTCLFQVYRYYYGRLHELWLTLNPPVVREVPAPTASPQMEIAGVPFGIKK